MQEALDVVAKIDKRAVRLDIAYFYADRIAHFQAIFDLVPRIGHRLFYRKGEMLFIVVVFDNFNRNLIALFVERARIYRAFV